MHSCFPTPGSWPGIAVRAELPTTRKLPVALANEAALAGCRHLPKVRYAVTATILDASGLPNVIMKGANTQPQTLEASRRKVYAVVTLGPIFNDRWRIESSPRQLMEHLTVVEDDVVAGAIGIGGAPGGQGRCLRESVDSEESGSTDA